LFLIIHIKQQQVVPDGQFELEVEVINDPVKLWLNHCLLMISRVQPWLRYQNSWWSHFCKRNSGFANISYYWTRDSCVNCVTHFNLGSRLGNSSFGCKQLQFTLQLLSVKINPCFNGTQNEYLQLDLSASFSNKFLWLIELILLRSKLWFSFSQTKCLAFFSILHVYEPWSVLLNLIYCKFFVGKLLKHN